MDAKDLADEKRRLGIRLCQPIREFEQATGLEVTGIKIKRDENDQKIDSVVPKVVIPDIE